MGDDFDAVSALSDIPLDGEGDLPSFPAVPVLAPAPPSVFSFDHFGSPPRPSFNKVKVTDDDEIEKFEDQFPELNVSHVRLSFLIIRCGARVVVHGVVLTYVVACADRVAASPCAAYVWSCHAIRTAPSVSRVLVGTHSQPAGLGRRTRRHPVRVPRFLMGRFPTTLSGTGNGTRNKQMRSGFNEGPLRHPTCHSSLGGNHIT